MSKDEIDEIKLNEEYSVFFKRRRTGTLQPYIRHHAKDTEESVDFPIVATSAAGLMALKLRDWFPRDIEDGD